MHDTNLLAPLGPHRQSRTMLFIHSLHFNSRCWDGWMSYYRSRGHVCHAPAWPYHSGDPAPEKKRSSAPKPLTLAEIVEMYIFIIEEEIRESPIIIGHGTGAIIARILASFGLADHCVCLAARPAHGLTGYLSHWSLFLHQALRKSSAKIPSFRTFHQSYANTATAQQARALYEKHLYPEHGKTIRNFGHRSSYYDSIASSPVLFLSGQKDKLASPRIAQRNFQKYYPEHSGNLHRVILGFDHMSFFRERFIPEIAILIDAWLSMYVPGSFYFPGSRIAN